MKSWTTDIIDENDAQIGIVTYCAMTIRLVLGVKRDHTDHRKSDNTYSSAPCPYTIEFC